MRHNTYQSVGDTHITVPGDFWIQNEYTFRRTKVFAEKGSRVPQVIGEIHHVIGGKVALVNTHFFQRTNESEGRQIIAVDSLSQTKYYGRAYDPGEYLTDQIELVAIVALKGDDLS